MRWHAQSQDSSCPDFFLRRHINTLVCDTVDKAKEPVARFVVAMMEIRDIPGIFHIYRDIHGQ